MTSRCDRLIARCDQMRAAGEKLSAVEDAMQHLRSLDEDELARVEAPVLAMLDRLETLIERQ